MLLLTIIVSTLIKSCIGANILMITMGGTKSHKIPFWELARGLIPRGHNITFISAFPAEFLLPGLEEITPTSFVFYVKNYTDWDLVGNRMRGKEAISFLDIFRYPYEACEILFSDPETKDFLRAGHAFDLLILDGAFPECAIGLLHRFNAPFMYINTVGFYTGSLALAGNPVPYSVTPFLTQPFTENMNIVQRAANSAWYIGSSMVHTFLVKFIMQNILREHFGKDVPPIYETAKNVSFILQNSYATIGYPRAYLPNVAEVACIHCKPAKPLPWDLEEFINGSGDAGFIFVSMGSSVKAANMPEYLRRLFLCVFRQLPQRVLWKWEGATMEDLPSNVKLSRWLPQQDLLGHRKIRGFITHGGLLSMFETIYHGVPIVSMPVFCDHESNAAKAELDGYAVKLDLSIITADSLLWAIKKIMYDPKFKEEVKKRQILLKDQKETPLERAVYWTEYVIRHRGAKHLQSIAKDLNVFQYFLIDVLIVFAFSAWMMWILLKFMLQLTYTLLTGNMNLNIFRKTVKVD